MTGDEESGCRNFPLSSWHNSIRCVLGGSWEYSRLSLDAVAQVNVVLWKSKPCLPTHSMYRDYEILSSLNHKRHYIKTIVIVQVTLALDRGE